MRHFEIRQSQLSDSSALGEFILTAWREAGPRAFGWTGANDQVIENLVSEESLKAILTNPKMKVFTCREGDRILGFAVNRRLDLETVELAGVIVLEGLTGKGIGTRLVAKAMEEAKKDGFSTMQVKTEVFNERALSFYKKERFTATRRETENVTGTPVELQVLELRL